MILVVTAAIIFNEKNELLIAQRKPESHNPLKWEFPGGCLEENETPECCLAREIKEELDINIEIENIYKVVYHQYPEKNILLLFYKCRYASGILKNIECNDARWIKPAELVNYNISDADLSVALSLQNNVT